MRLPICEKERNGSKIQPLARNARGSHHAMKKTLLSSLIRSRIGPWSEKAGPEEWPPRGCLPPSPTPWLRNQSIKYSGKRTGSDPPSRQTGTSGPFPGPQGGRRHWPRREEAPRHGRGLRGRDSTPPWSIGERWTCPPWPSATHDPPREPGSTCPLHNGGKGPTELGTP